MYKWHIGPISYVTGAVTRAHTGDGMDEKVRRRGAQPRARPRPAPSRRHARPSSPRISLWDEFRRGRGRSEIGRVSLIHRRGGRGRSVSPLRRGRVGRARVYRAKGWVTYAIDR